MEVRNCFHSSLTVKQNRKLAVLNMVKILTDPKIHHGEKVKLGQGGGLTFQFHIMSVKADVSVMSCICIDLLNTRLKQGFFLKLQ